MQRRLRQRLDRVGQGEGQQIGRDGRDHADPERPGERIARGPRGDRHAGRRRQRRARLRDDAGRAGVDPHGPAFAFEQAEAELRLELEDLAAQRRLADVAGRRRPAEMAMIGDRDGIFEVPEVHETAIGDNDDRQWNNRLDRLSMVR